MKRMSHQSAAIALLLGLVWAAGPGGRASAREPEEVPAEPDKPFVHAPSGFVFPAEVGKFRRQKAHRFDDAGRNVSVAYSHTDIRMELTAFVYPGVDIPLAAHFEQVKRDVIKSWPGEVEVKSEGEWALRQGEKRYTGRRALFSISLELENGGRLELRSELCLLKHDGNFVKCRITYPEARREALEPQIAAFLENLSLPPAKQPAAAPVQQPGTQRVE